MRRQYRVINQYLLALPGENKASNVISLTVLYVHQNNYLVFTYLVYIINIDRLVE